MTRLQKKCIIATAGFHLLLLVILFLGPAFFWRQPEPDNLPMLKVIPSSAVDAALSSGVANPTPPAPVQPPQPPTPAPPTPTPPLPQPVETPRPPTPEPVRPVEPKPEETPTPDEQPSIEPSPAPRPKPPKHTIEVDLTPVHSTSHHTDTTARDEAKARQEEREARAEERRRAAALHDLTSSLEHNLSGSTEVRMPGAGSASYANYGQIVKSIYYNAWQTPDNASDDNASPKVRVVIARDGTVISAQIIDSSGDAAVDDSVKQALDRVTFIQAFPDGASESQRSYTIRFNLKAKRMLE